LLAKTQPIPVVETLPPMGETQSNLPPMVETQSDLPPMVDKQSNPPVMVETQSDLPIVETPCNGRNPERPPSQPRQNPPSHD